MAAVNWTRCWAERRRGTLEYIDYHCEVYPSAWVTLLWGDRDSLEYMAVDLILPYHGDDA